MASPFPDATHKKQFPFPMQDGGIGEVAVLKSSGAVEFSRTWDGVNWEPVTTVVAGLTVKGLTAYQETPSRSDLIVATITTASERIQKASADLGATGSWDNYENF